jgi:probable HAF family extracellular repeat protein
MWKLNRRFQCTLFHAVRNCCPGAPSGGTGVIANAINNRGQVVGSFTLIGQPHGFIYDERKGMRDLNRMIDPASGWSMLYAHGINDRGQIVGVGTKGASQVAILLDPAEGDDQDEHG